MSRLASSLVVGKGTKAKIMRAKVIEEIIKTERNYAKQLGDIVEVRNKLNSPIEYRYK